MNHTYCKSTWVMVARCKHHLNYMCLSPPAGDLQNGPMQWAPVYYGPSVSVGSNFKFDSDPPSLTPKQMGIYFMYIELNFTCTYKCQAAVLSVHVGDELTCEVQLPANNRSVTKKCWTVSQMNGQSLHTQMTIPEGGLSSWKLELKGSGFGMFLMD